MIVRCKGPLPWQRSCNVHAVNTAFLSEVSWFTATGAVHCETALRAPHCLLSKHLNIERHVHIFAVKFRHRPLSTSAVDLFLLHFDVTRHECTVTLPWKHVLPFDVRLQSWSHRKGVHVQQFNDYCHLLATHQSNLRVTYSQTDIPYTKIQTLGIWWPMLEWHI
jgi:hypothetical protein